MHCVRYATCKALRAQTARQSTACCHPLQELRGKNRSQGAPTKPKHSPDTPLLQHGCGTDTQKATAESVATPKAQSPKPKAQSPKPKAQSPKPKSVQPKRHLCIAPLHGTGPLHYCCYLLLSTAICCFLRLVICCRQTQPLPGAARLPPTARATISSR